MPSSADLKKKSFPKILVVGDGGTGKTRFAASCPSPYIFSFDDNLDSAAEFAFDYDMFKDAPWKAIESKQAHDPSIGIYPWGTGWDRMVDKLDDVLWPQVKAGTLPYKTIVIDSITTMANLSINQVLKLDNKTGRTNPQVQHWGQQLRNLETVIEEICSWPVMVVVTAHVRRDENLLAGGIELLPLVGGQFGAKIGIYFSEVYYMKVEGSGKDKKVTFQTEQQGLYKMAKSGKNVPNGTEAKWSAVEKYLIGGTK